jgi:hypothetical protein
VRTPAFTASAPVSSARGDEHLKALLRAMPAHRAVADVSELEERARQVAAQKAA